MTTIVKAADAAQFLSLVPGLLGFHPSRSLVLVPFDGSRSLGAMRIDLPPTDDGEDVNRFAATVIGMVCRIPEADAVALVVFTDESPGTSAPRAALAHAVESRADACGVHLTDALWVGAEGWASYLDPSPIRPLAEISTPELWAVPGDQESGATLPHADPGERESVARALDSLDEAVRRVCGASAPGASFGVAAMRTAAQTDPDAGQRIDPRALTALCELDDLPTLFESALEWDPDDLTAYNLATIAWCLSRPALRDIALVGWCSGLDAGDRALDAQLKWEAGEEYPAHLAMHMWGEGDRPDAERLVRALELVRRVAATSPSDRQAGALATAAWLAWALGRSTHADVYARQACELEPEHGLAEIVRSFILVGHLPSFLWSK